MRRREFIAGLGLAATWPLAAVAQQGDRVRAWQLQILRLRAERASDEISNFITPSLLVLKPTAARRLV